MQLTVKLQKTFFYVFNTNSMFSNIISYIIIGDHETPSFSTYRFSVGQTDFKGVLLNSLRIKVQTVQRITSVRCYDSVKDIAAANETDILVLGAFGCGAFCNDPISVANAYADALKESLNMIRRFPA